MLSQRHNLFTFNDIRSQQWVESMSFCDQQNIKPSSHPHMQELHPINFRNEVHLHF